MWGEAEIYGFHSTLADALYFATEAELERVMAEVRMLSESFPSFTLKNFRIPDLFKSNNEIVLQCDDDYGITESLHHELVSRVYRTAISSTYLTGQTKKQIIHTTKARSHMYDVKI